MKILKSYFLLFLSLTIIISTICFISDKLHRQNDNIVEFYKPVSKQHFSADELLKNNQGIRFVENKGQFDSETYPELKTSILFVGDYKNVRVFVTKEGISYLWPEENKNNKTNQSRFVHVKLKDMNTDTKIKGVENYLDRNGYEGLESPHKITWANNYKKIIFENVYKNIDFILYEKSGHLKYDFVIKPGGDVKDIQLQYENVKELQLQKDGSLKVVNIVGEFTEDRPYTFISGDNKEVLSKYELKENTISFDVGSYDKTKTLIIDPKIEWTTPNAADLAFIGTGIAIDSDGEIFLCGGDRLSNTVYPIYNVFLKKFSETGTLLKTIFIPTISGSGVGYGHGLDIDSSGNVYFLANTNINGLGKGSGVAQFSYGGGLGDAYIAKYNNGLSQKIIATYLGGNNNDIGDGGLVIHGSNVFIQGSTNSSNFPISNAYQSTYAGNTDAFIAKLNLNLGLVWSTYYGGSGDDYGGGDITVDSNGNVIVIGQTLSTNFPVKSAFQGSNAGNWDNYVAKFNGNGGSNSLIWGTYLGGSGIELNDDFGIGIATDNSNNVYVSGTTGSTNFPVSSGAFQSTSGGGDNDAFLFKFTSSGARSWGTYLGGSGRESYADGLQVNSSNEVIVFGTTTSANFPLRAAFQNTYGGGSSPNLDSRGDNFLSKFNANGAIIFSTYFGNGGAEVSWGGMALNANQDIILHSNRNFNILLAKISDGPIPTAVMSGGGASCGGDGVPITVDFSGTPPYSFTYTNGSSSTPVTTSQDPYTFTVSDAGTYTITKFSDSNSSGVFSGSATVSIDSRPDPSDALILGCTTVCTGATSQEYIYHLDLSATNYEYQWSIIGSNNGASIVGSATGSEVELMFSQSNPSGDTITLRCEVGNSCDTATIDLPIKLDKSCVWPGDVNYNGIVEPIDFNIFVALLSFITNKNPGNVNRVMSCTDTNCLGVNTYDWSPQPSTDWGDFLASNTPTLYKNQVKNLKHFDTNGDGEIETEFDQAYEPTSLPCLDSEVIEYSIANANPPTHNFNTYKQNAAVDGLEITTVSDQLVNGERQVTLEVTLGSPSNPINISGISFEIDLDNLNFNNPSWVYFDDFFTPYKLGTQGADMFTMELVKNTDPSVAVVALQRPDNTEKTFTGDTLLRVFLTFPNSSKLSNKAVATTTTSTLKNGKSLSSNGSIVSYNSASTTFGGISLSAHPISWTDLVGVSANGNSLTKTAGTTWNAGAASTNVIPANQDGFIEMTIDNPATDVMFGLSYMNTNAAWYTIDFSLYMSEYRGRYIIINQGANQITTNTQLGSYAQGDVVRVERVGSSVNFLKNGTILYTLPVDASKSMVADVAMYNNGCKILNAVCSAPPLATSSSNALLSNQTNKPQQQLIKVDVIPNPINRELVISLNNISESTHKVFIEIYNMSHQMVKQKEINITSGLNKYLFDMSNQSTGLYFAVITLDSGHQSVYKIIKK